MEPHLHPPGYLGNCFYGFSPGVLHGCFLFFLFLQKPSDYFLKILGGKKVRLEYSEPGQFHQGDGKLNPVK